jgi:type I restriction enzyme M protein
MIMHGDGHGGIRYHDGFINVKGIFEGRFDIILTNSPFGANVEPSDVVHEADVTMSRNAEKQYREDYSDLYTDAMARVRAAVDKPIASLFELPRGAASKTKTEILFIERCLGTCYQLMTAGCGAGCHWPSANNSALPCESNRAGTPTERRAAA